jgi:hypothetical protein
MKKISVTLTTLLIIGLTGFVYGEMGKCNGMQNPNMKNKSGMMMGKDFIEQRAMIYNNISKAKACVDAATTTEDLSTCRMGIMQRNQGMMQNNKGMMGNSPGKCNGKQGMMQNGKGMMQNSNSQGQIDQIKQCVHAATTLQEIKNCKVGMMQGNKGMMKNSPGKCNGN